MGITLYLGIERGKIACHKSGARVGTLLREGCLASWAFRDESFWRIQVNFGPPNPATDEKALWSKGKCVRCHTPYLPKVPRGWARCSRATIGERVPHWKRDRRWPSQGPGVRFFYLTEDDNEDLLTDEDAMSQDEEEVFSLSWSESSEGGEFPNLCEPKEKSVQSTKGSGNQFGSFPRRPQIKKERLKAESLSKRGSKVAAQ
ncbi:hypothetical protein CQW23_31793 [Capsicum baccatum]|uniref:Uncharacterized protein n=1 Tax=Capsicum baccatum TaxID=33114 RepID=A0A2G2V6K1_CAPBA|nr:hypothetical protein CQW23_31793 [Capsicum baccatum]